ncbi:MAG: tetratricopeptide repeat protein [Pseudomonadota bacterium]
MHNKPLLLSLSVLALGLHACSSSSGMPTGSYKSNSAYQTNKSKKSAGKVIDRAIQRALAEAETAQERLSILSQMHARDPDNHDLALQYAIALREDEQINAARRVLDGFTSGENKTAEALTEMAITNIALGDFAGAEENAANALELSPRNGRAFLAMGTAQDAQGNHEKAEESFRKGIDNWKGDPAPVLNNLALNLATQGRLDQAIETLQKAKEISPHRMEIERNLRIISTLRETAGPLAPKPSVKPTPPEKKEIEVEEQKLDLSEEIDDQADTEEPVKKIAPKPQKKSFSFND